MTRRSSDRRVPDILPMVAGVTSPALVRTTRTLREEGP